MSSEISKDEHGRWRRKCCETVVARSVSRKSVESESNVSVFEEWEQWNQKVTDHIQRQHNPTMYQMVLQQGAASSPSRSGSADVARHQTVQAPAAADSCLGGVPVDDAIPSWLSQTAASVERSHLRPHSTVQSRVELYKAALTTVTLPAYSKHALAEKRNHSSPASRGELGVSSRSVGPDVMGTIPEGGMGSSLPGTRATLNELFVEVPVLRAKLLEDDNPVIARTGASVPNSTPSSANQTPRTVDAQRLLRLRHQREARRVSSDIGTITRDEAGTKRITLDDIAHGALEPAGTPTAGIESQSQPMIHIAAVVDGEESASAEGEATDSGVESSTDGKNPMTTDDEWRSAALILSGGCNSDKDPTAPVAAQPSPPLSALTAKKKSCDQLPHRIKKQLLEKIRSRQSQKLSAEEQQYLHALADESTGAASRKGNSDSFDDRSPPPAPAPAAVVCTAAVHDDKSNTEGQGSDENSVDNVKRGSGAKRKVKKGNGASTQSVSVHQSSCDASATAASQQEKAPEAPSMLSRDESDQVEAAMEAFPAVRNEDVRINVGNGSDDNDDDGVVEQCSCDAVACPTLSPAARPYLDSERQPTPLHVQLHSATSSTHSTSSSSLASSSTTDHDDDDDSSVMANETSSEEDVPHCDRSVIPADEGKQSAPPDSVAQKGLNEIITLVGGNTVGKGEESVSSDDDIDKAVQAVLREKRAAATKVIIDLDAEESAPAPPVTLETHGVKAPSAASDHLSLSEEAPTFPIDEGATQRLRYLESQVTFLRLSDSTLGETINALTEANGDLAKRCDRVEGEKRTLMSQMQTMTAVFEVSAEETSFRHMLEMQEVREWSKRIELLFEEELVVVESTRHHMMIEADRETERSTFEAMAQRHDALLIELHSLQCRYEEDLAQLDEDAQSERTQLLELHSTLVDQLHRTHADDVERLEVAHKQALFLAEQTWSETIKALREEFEDTAATTQSAHEQETSLLLGEHRRRLRTLQSRAMTISESANERATHLRDENTAQKFFNVWQQATLRRRHARQTESLTLGHASALKEIALHHQEASDVLQRELSALRKEYDAAVATLQRTCRELDETKELLHDSLRQAEDYRDDITASSNAREAERAEHNLQQEKARTEYLELARKFEHVERLLVKTETLYLNANAEIITQETANAALFETLHAEQSKNKRLLLQRERLVHSITTLSYLNRCSQLFGDWFSVTVGPCLKRYKIVRCQNQEAREELRRWREHLLAANSPLRSSSVLQHRGSARAPSPNPPHAGSASLRSDDDSSNLLLPEDDIAVALKFLLQKERQEMTQVRASLAQHREMLAQGNETMEHVLVEMEVLSKQNKELILLCKRRGIDVPRTLQASEISRLAQLAKQDDGLLPLVGAPILSRKSPVPVVKQQLSGSLRPSSLQSSTLSTPQHSVRDLPQGNKRFMKSEDFDNVDGGGYVVD